MQVINKHKQARIQTLCAVGRCPRLELWIAAKMLVQSTNVSVCVHACVYSSIPSGDGVDQLAI